MMMDYKDLERALRAEARTVADQKEDWPAERVARKLEEIASVMTVIRRQHMGAVNASMGKRSGTINDI